MPIILDVNPVFDEWKSSTGWEKERASRVLIHRMGRYAMAICYQRLPDHRNELEALVNQIVWRAFDKLESFKGKAKFSTWFYRIVVNECNRYLRAFKKKAEVEFKDEVFVNPNNSLDATLDIIKIADRLKGVDHQMFRLVAEGYDFRTIAKSLGMPLGTVLSLWSRLKERLRNA